MEDKKIRIITIDGPAASGKGTLARRLARHLGYFYLDTGAIYRLIGLAARKHGIEPETNPEAVAKIALDMAQNFSVEMLENPELKSDIAGQMASRSGALSLVRAAVLDLQRSLAANPPSGEAGSVLDGRDCGTVICPQADRKIYITADVEVRASRRFTELQGNGDQTPYTDVLADMKARDDRDMNRAAAPLKPAIDAVILDTSVMDADQAFDAVLKIVTQAYPDA